MTSNVRRAGWRAFIAVAFAIIVLSFQNCSPNFFGSKSSSAQMAGNGTGYEGKPTTYKYFDVAHACTDLDREGQALPNHVLFFKSGSEILLIRDNCADLAPQTVDPSDIQFVDAQHVIFRSVSFAKFDPDAFSVAAAACPSGLSPIAGAQRTNMVLSPVDLLAMPPWGYMPEISTSLAGAFDGLPSFHITRTAATPLNWQRLDQSIELLPNKQYAISFMAKAGNSNQVRLEMFIGSPGSVDAGGAWDLQSGSLIDSWNNNNSLTNVSYTSRPIPGGYFVTMYFTTPSAINSLDIGVSSNTLNQGDYVDVTAVQFEDVSTFCSP